MFNPFKLLEKVITWFTEGISARTKVILVMVAFMFIVGMGLVGYEINEYFENDPDACSMCHVHDAANKAWAHSVHHDVNCHQCHHSTKKDQIIQMYKFAVLGQRTVSPRHGAIIVAWKVCIECHWTKTPNILMRPWSTSPAIMPSTFSLRRLSVPNATGMLLTNSCLSKGSA